MSVGPEDGGTKYYGCKRTGHCADGQKIAITWIATPTPTLAPGNTRQPTVKPTSQPSAITAGLEEEDGSEDQSEDQGEDQGGDENEGSGGADAAGGGLAIVGIVVAVLVGLLCVGGFVRWKQVRNQNRTSRKGRETGNPLQRTASPATAI